MGRLMPSPVDGMHPEYHLCAVTGALSHTGDQEFRVCIHGILALLRFCSCSTNQIITPAKVILSTEMVHKHLLDTPHLFLSYEPFKYYLIYLELPHNFCPHSFSTVQSTFHLPVVSQLDSKYSYFFKLSLSSGNYSNFSLDSGSTP